MFCLECGHKIDEDKQACGNCGMSVEEIKERIAAAQEKVTYAETVGPDSTLKLPPVSQRVYYDKDGNLINPAEALEVNIAEARGKLVLPLIGDDEDPYITMPVQKVVSDEGVVLTAEDTEQKIFIQPPKKDKGLPVWAKFLIAFVAALIAIAIGAVALNNMGLFDKAAVDTVAKQEAAANANANRQEANEEKTKLELYKALDSDYLELGNYRVQINALVTNFEGYFLVSNHDTRQRYADECATYIDEVATAKAALQKTVTDLGLKTDSDLYEAYEQIVKLYDCLLTRAKVIKQCWDVSLASSNPQADQAKILEPLSADLKQGKSVSMTEFDAIYPEVKFPEL